VTRRLQRATVDGMTMTEGERFEDNPTAMYLEAIANAMKAGDLRAAADLMEKLATFDPEAAEALTNLIKTLAELTREGE